MSTADTARGYWADKAKESDEMARVRAHERERCAKIAEQITFHDDVKDLRAYIAKKIRSGE